MDSGAGEFYKYDSREEADAATQARFFRFWQQMNNWTDDELRAVIASPNTFASAQRRRIKSDDSEVLEPPLLPP